MDYRSVEALLRTKPDIDAVDRHGMTPLMYAAQSQQEDAWASARTLLHAGANANLVDQQGRTALMLAVIGGQLRAIAQLLSFPGIDLAVQDAQGWDAVRHAVKNDRPDVLGLLLDAGAAADTCDRQGKRAVDFAFDRKNKGCCVAFWERGHYLNHVTTKGHTPISLCIVWKDWDLLRRLLKEGTSIDLRHPNGDTSLHSLIGSAFIADTLAIDRLLELGADATLPDAAGRTPMELAIDTSNCFGADNVRALCDHGADPNAPGPNKGLPLHWCLRQLNGENSRLEHRQCSHGRLEHIRAIAFALLEAGANPNLVDAGGDTALHICGKIDRYKSALWHALIARGASKNIRNRKGKKPFFHMSRSNTKEMWVLTAACGGLVFIPPFTLVGVPGTIFFGAIALARSPWNRVRIGNPYREWETRP
ncbi:MAG: ankyrin repeat domain-containing protein [Chlamydiia bacterium]|nr:ankyrin repeat domain-containing protein [Chlamydiia bacterium]